MHRLSSDFPSIPRHTRHSSRLALALCFLLVSLFFPVDSANANERVQPRIPEAGTLELHGTMYGERFWARLLPADARYGGNRVLQLLYTPPDPDDIGGTMLVDHPFLLLDNHARIIAWNERELGLSSVVFQGQEGYEIQHERSEMVSGQLAPTLVAIEVDLSQPAWDSYLAPLHAILSLRHREDHPQEPWLASSATFFTNPTQAVVHRIRGDHHQARLSPDLTVLIDWDDNGRIARLRNSEDPDVVIAEVRAWIATGAENGSEED
ncbi:MAG: hypothetical protein EA401_00200 [Planctomycetota bacterium]|nr:MAG: hypothetical protein EA401_00200 [Planctomycetota bacterium]